MNTSKSDGIGLPSTGAVLGFMVDCLGVSKEELGADGDHAGYKDLELLRKGGMSPWKDGRVMLRVMEAVVASFMEPGAAKGTLREVLKQQVRAPVRRIQWEMFGHVWIPVPQFEAAPEQVEWRWDSAGRLQNLKEHLVHDWTEFQYRHSYLVKETGGSGPVSQLAVMAWAMLFVVPLLAANLVDYQQNGSHLETGMPGGRFWYLPALIEGNGEGFRYRWPVNQVLEWWEDLLGSELYQHAALLCDLGYDADGARRQIHAWRYENRAPKPATIARWCKASWRDKYKGTFQDDKGLPLAERWKRCRAFLERKGFNDFSKNWLEEAGGPAKLAFGDQYRGERLEHEILPFRDLPFRSFFDEPDAIAAGLPVEEMIRRIAERYAVPTNEQIKARLLVASAVQRAFGGTSEFLGPAVAEFLLTWFKGIYCFLMDIHQRANKQTRADVLRLLQSLPEEQSQFGGACEWLYDEDCWRRLPHEIVELVRRSEVEGK